MTDNQPTHASEPVYESNPFKLVKPSFDVIKRVARVYVGSIILLVLPILLVAFVPAIRTKNVPLSQVVEQVDADKVESIEVAGDKLIVTLKDPKAPKQIAYKESSATLADYGVDDSKVRVISQNAEDGSGRIFDIILVLLPIGFFLIMACLSSFWALLILKAVKGEDVRLSEILKSFPRYILPIVVTGILTVLAFLAGLILLIVPGFIFFAWFSLVSIAIVNENLGVVAALKRSKELVKGHVPEMLAMLSVSSLAFVPTNSDTEGLLMLISFLFALIYLPAFFIRYFQLKELKAKDLPKPKVHWINYAIIVVTLLAIGMSISQSKVEVERPEPGDAGQYEYSL